MNYLLNIESSSQKFIDKLQAKQFKQVLAKILSLLSKPTPQDCKKLSGVEGGYRVDQGEYRILYRIKWATKEKPGEIQIWRVGKRNDDEVYRHL